MSSITNLSVQQLRQAADLKEAIEGLEKELARLTGAIITPVTVTAAKAPKQGGMSAAGRARLVAAQKARWAKIKAAKSAVAVTAVKPAVKSAMVAPPAKKKFTMSAAAKAKLSAAAKARWAKVRAAKK